MVLFIGNPKTRAWNTSLIIECVCYFAVPLFFMISGANLMKYRERYTTKEFYKKRFVKVLIPFFFWATFMFIWKIYIIKSLPIENVNTPIKLLNAFFSNKEEGTYYFMFEILGVYLAMPLFSLLTKREYKNTLWLIVGTFFIFNGMISNILPLLKINWNESFKLPINGYCIYVILGYLLSEQEFSKKQKVSIYIGALVGIIYRYVTTFILSKQLGKVVKLTWGYSSWHGILLAASVFIIVKNMKLDGKIQNCKFRNAVIKIANCSFGIYLIHKIVMHYEIILFDINTSSAIWRTCGVISTYMISLIIIYVMKKIPIIKKIVP